MGKAAAQLLIDVSHGKMVTEAAVFAPELVVRDSTRQI
jgi:DNA-binding LacI/PurR family transcriptional regulator